MNKAMNMIKKLWNDGGVRRMLLTFAATELVCSGLMVGVFALLGKYTPQVAVGAIVGSIFSIGNLCPAWSIVLSDVDWHSCKEVVACPVALWLVLIRFFLCHSWSCSEDIVPSDSTIVAHENHLLGCHADNLIARTVPHIVVGNIWEVGLSREREEQVVAINLEIVGSSLFFNRHVEVIAIIGVVFGKD